MNIALTLWLDAGGPDVIVVDGPSTVQVWLAGVASTVPAVLTARTSSVCVPTVSASST